MAFQLKNIASKQKQHSSFDINTLIKKEITYGTSFTTKKKERFYTELYVLLHAGLPLKDALLLIGEEQKKLKNKTLIKNIVTDLINGKNFSNAIKEKKEFSAYEYHSLKIGEQTGTIQNVTKELGAFYKRKNKQRRIILSALSYPIVVLLTAFLAIVFMLQFVVPMFADIFRQNKVALPWITKKILSTATFFQEYWYFSFGIAIGIFLFVKLHKKKIWYQKITTTVLLKTPLIGAFIRKVKMAQFTQAITLLTAAKVPLLNGIQLTKKMIGYHPLETALEKIEHDILQGKSLHESMSNYTIFDKKMVSLIKVADETNQNETIFQRLTEQYNEEIEYQSNMISATIEPLIIVFLGAIVATILIAMYLPMFQLSSAIGN